MKRFVRAAIGMGAAIGMALSLGVVQARADGPSVYTTPGGQIVNGRLWTTECAKYSSTTFRCTTKIWATQVVHSKGKYVPVTGWHFNNLTYLPSSRAVWTKNPLGAYGQVGGTAQWTSSGLKWRTECDTAATGRGACRSYVWTTIVSGKAPYTKKSGWVFNNIVRFAEGGIKPVTKVPAHVLDQSRLTMNGLGPLGRRTNFDATMLSYARLGYLKKSSYCDVYVEGPPLERRQIVVTGRFDVQVQNPKILTDKGAHVGMTVGDVRSIYGAAFKVLPKDNYGIQQYFGSVREGGREMLFRVPGVNAYAPERPLRDSDRIGEILVGDLTNEVSSDGC